MIATVIHIAAAAGLGGLAGLLGGMFGVGGGFLVIPLLGFFYGMDQQTAQGTVLIMVVPNVVWAFSRYRRRFGVDLRMAATIAGSALIATYPTASVLAQPSHRRAMCGRRPSLRWSPTTHGAAVRGLRQDRGCRIGRDQSRPGDGRRHAQIDAEASPIARKCPHDIGHHHY